MQPSGSASNEIHAWFAEEGQAVMKELGIQAGDKVLDIGSGPGRFGVPLAWAVGSEGRVIAVEHDFQALQTLQERLQEFGAPDVVDPRLDDVYRILPALNTESVDAVFLFDILQVLEDRPGLFQELNRICRKCACIHVYPAAVPHPGLVDMDAVRQGLASLGFDREETRVLPLLHARERLEDTVHTFSRQQDMPPCL